MVRSAAMARDGNFWYNAHYMTKGVQVAAFTGGGLRMQASGEKSREAVLALPLSRFLVKMVQVPQGEDPVEYVTPFVKALSPFPDEPLSVTFAFDDRNVEPILSGLSLTQFWAAVCACSGVTSFA